MKFLTAGGLSGLSLCKELISRYLAKSAITDSDRVGRVGLGAVSELT